MKLDGQIAIVVGSARGIGETIAHTFAQEGASIVLVDLEKMRPELDGVAQEITRKGGKAMAIVADCTDDRQVNAMVDETLRRWGKIDILVNSAGLRGPLVPVEEISEQEWDLVLDVNLKAVFLCCRAVLKQMIKQKSGSIVSISGTAGKEGMALRGSLCAAKWGLIGSNADYRERSWPARHKSQHHLSRRHGRTGPSRHVRGTSQRLGHGIFRAGKECLGTYPFAKICQA